MADEKQLFFKLVDGSSYRKSLASGQDENEALRSVLYGTEEWIEVDNSIHIHRAHIVSVQLTAHVEQHAERFATSR